MRPDEVVIKAKIVPQASMKGSVSSMSSISGRLSSVQGDVPIYTGEYEVCPKMFQDQMLRTRGLRMTKDVTVQEVPYWETRNQSGITVYIGGS